MAMWAGKELEGYSKDEMIDIITTLADGYRITDDILSYNQRRALAKIDLIKERKKGAPRFY